MLLIVVALFGVGLIVTGVALFSPAAGFIVAGVLLIGVAFVAAWVESRTSGDEPAERVAE